MDVDKLQTWLDPLDPISHMECDGMSRVISLLLDKNGIDHHINTGLLTDRKLMDDEAVSGGDHVAVTHWWIELPDGTYIDYRARMWMGPDAQHGVFWPDNQRFEYWVDQSFPRFSTLPEGVLSLICGVDLSKWPPLSQS